MKTIKLIGDYKILGYTVEDKQDIKERWLKGYTQTITQHGDSVTITCGSEPIDKEPAVTHSVFFGENIKRAKWAFRK